MEITIRYFDDCPNWKTTYDQIRELAEARGLDADVRLERVETDEDAQRVGFHGSPTVLIDGVDPFDAPGPVGLACRRYDTPEGLRGAPTIDQLAAALER